MKPCSTKLKRNLKRNSWADLDLDLLGEIRKRVYWKDHARFGGVCKNWLAAEHEIRAGDVLPWVVLLDQADDMNMLSYDLYQPLNLDQPILSRGIPLSQFFDLSRIENYSKSVTYLDGCLFFSLRGNDFTSTHFLLVSIPTDFATALPQFIHPPAYRGILILKAVSTYPFDPDCVFLAVYADDHHWTIGIFRHGDTEWTNTDFHFVEPFARPFVDNIVFLGGIFYFLCHGHKLASYDIASGELKVHSFLTKLYYGGIQKFFQLDGELMLFFYDINVRRCFLTRYDWSKKRWVPMKSLADCSLFLSEHSVYLDATHMQYQDSPNKIYHQKHYYQESRNKIYYQKHGTCLVYSFENGGELLASKSSGLRFWDGLHYLSPFSLWVEPPYLLPK